MSTESNERQPDEPMVSGGRAPGEGIGGGGDAAFDSSRPDATESSSSAPFAHDALPASELQNMEDQPLPSVVTGQPEPTVHEAEQAREEAAAGEDEEETDTAAKDDADEEVTDDDMDVEPLELIKEPSEDEEFSTDWYILKVQVNREDSIRDSLQRRVKVEGLDRFFKEIIVPTEDVAEFTKTGKRRVVKRKLYPGYIMVNMHLNDETWFLVRETPGIGDFTGSAGKPTPMLQRDVERILNIGKTDEGAEAHIKTAIPFKQGDRVRVKDGYFQNFEGDVESVDEANGRVTVMINIFGRSTPVELEHWQIEAV